MAGIEPGSAREEAERLVATVLAAAKLAAASSSLGRAAARSEGFGPLGEMISGVFGHTVGSPRADKAASSPTAGAAGAAGAGAAGGGGFATGGPECCICPVCRGIAALRDPSPEFAERLATGAGELAAGVAHLLRAFAEATGPTSPPQSTSDGPRPAPADSPSTPDDSPDDLSGGPIQDDEVWREATRIGHDSGPAPERDVWAVATHAEAPTNHEGAAPPADVAGPAGSPRSPAP